MTRRASITQAERPYTMDETADALGVSRRWLQDFIKDKSITFLAAGRKKLFDERALSEIREAMRCRWANSPAPEDATDFRDAAKILDDAIWNARQNRSGYVYFVKGGEAVKIGFSISVSTRLLELQTGCPRDVQYCWKSNQLSASGAKNTPIDSKRFICAPPAP